MTVQKKSQNRVHKEMILVRELDLGCRGTPTVNQPLLLKISAGFHYNGFVADEWKLLQQQINAHGFRN